jgi:hypothetical protein
MNMFGRCMTVEEKKALYAKIVAMQERIERMQSAMDASTDEDIVRRARLDADPWGEACEIPQTEYESALAADVRRIRTTAKNHTITGIPAELGSLEVAAGL